MRNQVIKQFMGKTVHVLVDRPVSYRHGDIVYPINYGYIPGTVAGDGEAQDVYILGIDDPIKEFNGIVIGAVRRKNDVEDKLVVAPVGMQYHQGEIAQAVHFQERFFAASIDSVFRKSCGVIPFRCIGKHKEYLILLQHNQCWSFPKGHMEAGESEQQTALRELFEETSLSAQLEISSRVVIAYDISPITRKQVVLFLGRTEGNVITEQSEITDYRWVRADEIEKYLHPDTYEACAHLFL